MSIARNTLKQVLLDNQKDIEQYNIFPRCFDLDSFPLQVFVGVRRLGGWQKSNVKVDFYVPEDELAVQVSYSIKDQDTYDREVGALTKLPNVHPCRRRVIITFDEEDSLTDKHGTIEVIPCWKWLLNIA